MPRLVPLVLSLSLAAAGSVRADPAETPTPNPDYQPPK